MNFKNGLPRSLDRLDATMMIVGNMIGIGIFTTTGYVADYIEVPSYLFAVWILGAIYAFCGALVYAELSTRFPVSGGDFHFLKAGYHPILGFFFGWSAFTVTYTGSIATISVGFATYFLNLLPATSQNWQLQPGLGLELNLIKVVAIGITVCLTWVNMLGVRQGARFQNSFTIAGVGIILAFVFWGFSSANTHSPNFTPFFPAQLEISEIGFLGVALVSVIFTYSGWTTIVYIAGEIKDPNRNIPFAMWTSVLLVALIYLLVNSFYLLSMPISQMKGVVDIGYQSMHALFGKSVGIIFSILIMLLTLSSLNSTILSGARIYYAMAAEGRFFRIAAKLHPRFDVPASSLWLQCGWSVILILSGTFNQLLTYTVFVMALFSFLSGVSLLILRKKKVETESTYRTRAFPLVLLFYLSVSAWILVTVLMNRPAESLIGILIIGLGAPFYFYWKRSVGVNLE
jgi:APA family basic amino acid/polyamine antiporter